MALVHGSIEKKYEVPERPAGEPAGDAEPSGDLYLRSPESERTDSGSLPLAAPLSSEPSRVDEVTWRSGEPRNPELLYDPLETEPGGPAEPQPGPDPADGSTLLFRLALSTAALLVLLVLARGFWWPEAKPRGSAAEPAAAPRSPAPAPLPVTTAPPSKPVAAEEPVIEEEEPEAPTPQPAAVPAAPPETAPAAPVRVQPAAPSREPAPLSESAAGPASPRRLPQPWEEGSQPPDLLKPGPGVQEPVPLDFPRYSYPAAARGTGLQVDVRLAVLVDENGRVIEARVREGAPPDLGFSETALAVAKRISFQPATRDDVPGKMWTEVILEFVE